MSIYSTKDITRVEAEKLVKAIRAKKDRSVEALTTEELDEELNGYVYSEKHRDLLGFHNFKVKD